MLSASQIPFAPLGPTITITANVAAPTAQQAPTTSTIQSAGQYRVVNASTNTIFLGVGSTAAAAQTAAGSAATSVPLLSGAVEILRFATTTWFSATASGASTLYITPGQGL